MFKTRFDFRNEKKEQASFDYDLLYMIQYSLLPSVYFQTPQFLPIVDEIDPTEQAQYIISTIYKALGEQLDFDISLIKGNVIKGEDFNLFVITFDSNIFDIEPLAKYFVCPFKVNLEEKSVSTYSPFTFETSTPENFFVATFKPIYEDNVVRQPLGLIGNYKDCIEFSCDVINQLTKEAKNVKNYS